MGGGVTTGQRTPGAIQGAALIAVAVMPTLAIVSLVPNLPQLFEHFRNVRYHEILVPMIITVPSLCIALFSPLAGAAADFWGRRPLLIVSLLAFTVLGLIPLMLDDLYLILASRFVVGVAEAGILTAGNALLGDYFSGDDRKKWLSNQTTVGPIAASLLILAGGKLGSMNWHAPFTLYALGLLVLAWVGFGTWEPARKAAAHDAVESGAAPFPWSKTAIVGGVTILLSVVYMVQAIQLGRIFGELGVKSPQVIGVVVTIASIGVITGGALYRRLAQLAIGRLFGIIFLALGIGYIGLAAAPDYRVGLAFAVVAQFGNGLTLPTLISWALSKYGFAHRGRGMGVWGSCFFVGTFLSPMVVSLVGTFTGSFLRSVGVIGVICLAASVVVWTAASGRRAPAVLTPSR